MGACWRSVGAEIEFGALIGGWADPPKAAGWGVRLTSLSAWDTQVTGLSSSVQTLYLFTERARWNSGNKSTT